MNNFDTKIFETMERQVSVSSKHEKVFAKKKQNKQTNKKQKRKKKERKNHA